MAECLAPPRPRPLSSPVARLAVPLARKLVRARFRGLLRGEIELWEGNARQRFGKACAACPLQVDLRIHDPRFYAYLALRGSVGAAESYMLGHWECSDLTRLVRILAVNPEMARGLDRGPARLVRPLLRWFHLRHRNTRSGSRRNIEAHYDLGNDFYELFLDPTLTYSCAVFEDARASLRDAQIAKYDRICRKLELGPQDHVLEIGTGWGGFAIHAASRYGCRVTTTTISPQQHALARQRVREAGLSERVTVLLRDYRELGGQYDKLVSIEMIEAVGAQYFDSFFRVCSDRLRPEGMMWLQAILSPDPHYAESRRSVDFIKRYIFPGGQLPSLGAICASIGRATDLRLVHVEDMATHYATTLRHWRQRFSANLERISRLGFSESFLRMWEFYLCYCEGGFLERVIGVAQIGLAKPMCRRAPILGPVQPGPEPCAVSKA